MLAACLVVALATTAVISAATRSGDAARDAVVAEARDLAYGLRDGRVRSELDRHAPRAEIAARTGTSEPTAGRLLALGAGAPEAGRPVLLRTERVGASGSAVDVAWGGTSGGNSEFGPPAHTWIVCVRVELPATAIAATRWSVRDVGCPATAPSPHGPRVRIRVAGATAVPLLRPPCYGTSGYCPGG